MPLIDYSFLSKILPKAKIKKSFRKVKSDYLFRIRMAMALFFFGKGFCFATWASRIPDLKLSLQLSEADLGTILFFLPIGQLVAMPFSEKIVSRFGSRTVTIFGTLLYALFLTFLGLATTSWQLAFALFLFGVFGNFCNIASNTQGVITQQLFEKPVMGFFHGSWSLAGFFGALVSLLMIYLGLTPFIHFIIAFGFVALLIALNYKYLVQTKVTKNIEKVKKSIFQIPDTILIWLGVISFCCMASEGIMFDWSGVYFKEIVQAPATLVALGYTCFMITMATGRFLSDILVQKYGPRKVILTSGIVISIGLYTAVLLPYLITCTIAFMLVGFGVSNVIPIVFNATGKIKSVATETALTIISSISFLGFLIGPPIIGYIAEATSLRYSFATIGVFGIFITLITYRQKLFK